MRWVSLVCALALLGAGPAWSQASGVVINDYQLTAQDLAQLGGAVPPGNYWYDPVAGFWGRRGMPVEGQTIAGLRAGPLRADASLGTTGAFVNGRQLTVAEVAWLSRQGPVPRGRFWMGPQGVYGYEGGPPLGQVDLSGGGGGGGGGRSLSERGMLFSTYDFLKMGAH